MSLFPLPTNPQSVKANALVVGPDTSRGLYVVSNPAGPTGGNNYLISDGNIPIQMEIQPVYGGNPSSSLVLSSTALTSTVPILAPASLGNVIYASPELITITTPTSALNFATAGPAGTPLPVGQYMVTVFCQVDLQPQPGALYENGTVCTPVFWDGTNVYASFIPGTRVGSPATFDNPIRVFASSLAGPFTTGSVLTVDVVLITISAPTSAIPWQWQLRTLG